ncbi:MOSC domain-containing protein [Methylocystis iwaonis]|uniref:Molybdenum cofactor sulfurase related protein n=1 Tax=Methylocystis iwaonis TaxID=2885079 RepID=A0ABM8EAN4_9HYPH|nr:MOSC domain-containing protein [Methylocystis iwaonis]BDV35048.1 molybdenum cofactor sulfurase related protein [Methylocystis iwaonis]
MRLAQLYRYPVKGLSPEPLRAADLQTDGYFPCDRLFALENGPSGFDPAAPEHQPKIKFLMLMKNGALAGLATRYDEESGTLAISEGGREAVRANLRTSEGRAAIEAFLSAYVDEAQIRGPVKLLEAPDGFRFTDSKSGFVSLINLASVAEIEKAQGTRVDPLRFRGNLYIEGADAWAEAAWPGRTLKIGDATLSVLKMTDRCAATGVEPGTGRRDMDVVQTLRKNFGHVDCGVYARVEKGGRVAVGDALTLL